MQAPPTIYDSQGKPLALGHRLGKGGEGEVYELSLDSALVAKIYHKPISKEHAAKLSAMARLQTEPLKRIAAWPIDTCHQRPGGETIGLVMPKVSGHQEIHNLYSPKSRLRSFTGTTWQFLLRSAANLARAFAVVHEHGHLVGDVNHGNVLVSQQATVRLIDCDSFQIRADGRYYLCGVGVSTHVPPELQDGPLRVLRTEDHDSFGLAVLIFQILFMGRHPYSGSYLGPGDMPIERAIRENRFAYGASAGLRQMRQPPSSLDLAAVSGPVAELFERAFLSQTKLGGLRPRPREWVSVLEAVRTRVCPRNSAHLFPEGLSSCPWCDLETRSGVVFFYAASVDIRVSGFDLPTVWAHISTVPGPGAPPAIPTPAAHPMPPSPMALAASQKRARQIIAFLVVLVGTVWGIYLGSSAAIVIAISVFVAICILSATYPARGEAKLRLKNYQATIRRLQDAWAREAGDADFLSKKTVLERLKVEYQDLPALRQRKLTALEAGRRTAQLERFLDSHRIDKAKIQGIGASRTATLQSFGIETARDIALQPVLRVPGFGPVLAQTLIHWRRSVESQFIFDPSKGVDPADLAALDRSLTDRKRQIEQTLQSGAAELEKVRYAIFIRRQALLQQLEAAAKTVAQAEADLKVL